MSPKYPGLDGAWPLPPSTQIPTYSGLDSPAPDDGRRQFKRVAGAGKPGLVPVAQRGPTPNAELVKLQKQAEAMANAPDPAPGSFGAFKSK